MTKFKASAEIVEVNRYDFVVEAETKAEADIKLKEFLKGNLPYPHQDKPFNGVQCVDREAGMETQNVVSTIINEKI